VSSMRFLANENVSASVIRGLRERGHDVPIKGILRAIGSS
jgi:hypothetical protein